MSDQYTRNITTLISTIKRLESGLSECPNTEMILICLSKMINDILKQRAIDENAERNNPWMKLKGRNKI